MSSTSSCEGRVMIGVHYVPLDFPRILVGIAAVGGAFGAREWISATRSKRQRREQIDQTVEIIKKVGPSNGSPSLGAEIQASFDRVIEKVDGLSHVVDANAITTRLMASMTESNGSALGEIRRSVEGIDGRLGSVEHELSEHVDTVKQLSEKMDGKEST